MIVVSHDPKSTPAQAAHVLALLPGGCVEGSPAACWPSGPAGARAAGRRGRSLAGPRGPRRTISRPGRELGFRASVVWPNSGNSGESRARSRARCCVRSVRCRAFLLAGAQDARASLSIIGVYGTAVGMADAGLQGYSILYANSARRVAGSVGGAVAAERVGPVADGAAGHGPSAARPTRRRSARWWPRARSTAADDVGDPVALRGRRASGHGVVMPRLSALFITCGIFGGGWWASG